MRVDEHAQHAKSFVELNEAHATHVGGEVVNPISSIGCLDACILFLEIERQVVGFGEALIPLPLGFFIDRTDSVSFFEHRSYEMAADEAAGAGYQDVGFTHGFSSDVRCHNEIEEIEKRDKWPLVVLAAGCRRPLRVREHLLRPSGNKEGKRAAVCV